MKRFLTFIFAVVLIATFHHATALKCFADVKDDLCGDTPDGELVECPSSMDNPGCLISETDATTPEYGVDVCQRRCLELPPESVRCWYGEYGDGELFLKSCGCRSDGCNENFDTAGGF